ncbi:MAG TPA: nuclear transport factor 2 family protein [candidate division Zixibacteria bacterium]|nr:nuclear transport factor 2 family protein [candidate division Zixibacteria bacterium]
MSKKDINPAIKILDDYKAAVYAKNVDSFVNLYDENIVAFDMWGSKWNYRGIKNWRSMVDEWFASLGNDRVVVDFEQLQLSQSTNLASVAAFVKYTAVSPEGKTLRSLNNRMTMVFELKKGVWKITHEHTSAPANHDTLKVSLKR